MPWASSAGDRALALERGGAAAERVADDHLALLLSRPGSATSTVSSGGSLPSATVFSASAVSAVLSIVGARAARARGRPAVGAGVGRRSVLSIVVSCRSSSQRSTGSGRKALVAGPRPSISSLGEHRPRSRSARARVEHVAGEEGPHVVGDPVDRLARGPRLPSAVGMSSAIPASAVAAQLERLLELVLGVGELVRACRGPRPAAAGPRRCRGRWRSRPRARARRAFCGGSSSRAKNSLESWFDWSTIDVEVGDVVLEAALLARVEAAADAEQQQDDQQHADAERDHPAQHQLALAVGPRAPGARRRDPAGC